VHAGFHTSGGRRCLIVLNWRAAVSAKQKFNGVVLRNEISCVIGIGRIRNEIYKNPLPAPKGGLPRRDQSAAAYPLRFPNFQRRFIMAQEDVAAGKVKEAKGKLNDIAGAVKGDTGQQIKGKVQQGVGKVQQALGKDDPTKK